jgi:hypothetical protein
MSDVSIKRLIRGQYTGYNKKEKDWRKKKGGRRKKK